MTRTTIGQLDVNDRFRYRESGPEHVVRGKNRGGHYIREMDTQGRTSLLIHSTPVYIAEVATEGNGDGTQDES